MKILLRTRFLICGSLVAWYFFGEVSKFALADGFFYPLSRRCSPSYETRSTHPIANGGFAGDWHWSRSPEQEKRVVLALYNRYCVRCHGVDGKGVWDVPDVPDFTNARWQQCRTDEQLVRLTIEGRGACMPAFRGTLSVEETWAMARYLRTFALTPRSESFASPGTGPKPTSDDKSLADPKKSGDKDR